MQAVQVSGRFVDELGNPMSSVIRFIPNMIWLQEGELAYPTLAPEVQLLDGRFSVELTRTDQHGLPWHYTVVCPVGKWSFQLIGEGPFLLKELLPKKFA